MERGGGDGVESWVEDELAGCVFADGRLGRRFRTLVAQFAGGIGESIPMACQDWAAEPAPASAVFTARERALLDELMPDLPRENNHDSRHLSRYITKVARLGGYLARAKDPPPGNIVIWRGLSRLTDITIGFQMAKDVGN